MTSEAAERVSWAKGVEATYAALTAIELVGAVALATELLRALSRAW